MSYISEGNIIQELWLIVEWKTSKNKHCGYTLVSSEDLANDFNLQDLHTGKVVKIKIGKRVRKASIVIVSADRGFLEMEIKLLQEAAQQTGLMKKPVVVKDANQIIAASSTAVHEDIPEGISQSDSDWQPESSDNDSENQGLRNAKRNTSKANRGWRNTSKPLHTKSTPKTSHQYPNLKDPHINRRSTPEYINDPRRQSGNLLESPGQLVMDLGPYAPERIDEIEESPSHLLNYKERLKSFQITRNDNETNRSIKMAVPPMTFDQQTQTKVTNADGINIELLYESHNRLSAEVSYLHKTLNDLRNQMESMQRSVADVNHFGRQSTSVITTNIDPNTQMEYIDNTHGMDENNANNIVLRESNSQHSTDRNINTPINHNGEVPHYLFTPPVYKNDDSLRDPPPSVASRQNPIAETADMMAIGSGTTVIPRHIFRQINWSSYSHATRKLLMAIFPRRTLATHSLTGKSSPAFTNKPAKMQLDVKKITDIIVTVTDMCKVQENLVRNIITTKCADENKMYRMRMEKMKSKKAREFETNQENQFP